MYVKYICNIHSKFSNETIIFWGSHLDKWILINRFHKISKYKFLNSAYNGQSKSTRYSFFTRYWFKVRHNFQNLWLYWILWCRPNSISKMWHSILNFAMTDVILLGKQQIWLILILSPAEQPARRDSCCTMVCFVFTRATNAWKSSVTVILDRWMFTAAVYLYGVVSFSKPANILEVCCAVGLSSSR